MAKSIRRRAENVTAMPSHFLVPLGRRDDFVGRERLLEQLLNIIPPAAYPHDCQRTAVEGLGGIGKTRLVLEAAYHLHEKDPTVSVFWVPAVNITMLENAYREIGQRLGIDGINEDNADVKSLVKAALSRVSAGSWLFILDNADDPELIFEHLMDALPSSPSGSVLVTTRNHEVVAHLDISPKAVFTLEALTPAEGDEFLRNGLAERQCRDSQSITRLLEFLTYLPLAIKQASAYMYQRGMTVTKYLQYCDESDTQFVQLLSKDFEDRTRYRDLQNPVATTWLISFQHIMHTQPEAADLLKFICFLGEKNIPTSLFYTGPDTLQVDEALGMLRGYAFLIDRGESESFDIHRLVRLAMRNWIEQNQTWSTWVTDSIDRLDSRFPWPEHDTYQRQGRWEKAETLEVEVLEKRKTKLGADHPFTLASMSNLALAYQRQGRWEKAETLEVEVLEKRKTKLGADHPFTLASMSNLASTYRRQGRWDKAETLDIEVMEKRKTKLGADHPDTLTIMGNLAVTYWKQGRWEKAETLQVEVMETSKAKLGADHPSTLTSMANLAYTWQAQGRLTEALDSLSECYKLQCRVIGPNHPSSVNALRTLNKWHDDSRGRFWGVHLPVGLLGMITAGTRAIHDGSSKS
ncbi:hypothetical protein N3K66_007209 [Trichothecium roseum]|uniref:Uncharacterized protein n=1 Tax=Trichothecium roseum TaxID=47278 RepID=A0ACC0UTM5_9HYPO|nr:hypothetical protein N3K66_007209 [Trichothecium roseum]